MALAQGIRNAYDKVKSGRSRTAPTPSDPESLENAFAASELKNPRTYTPGRNIRLGEKRSREIARLVNDRFLESQRIRATNEGQWATALAYWSGNQWMQWSPERGLRDTRDLREKAWYRTVNLIRPFCRVATARITSNRPDVQILPRSRDSELDTKAAQELRLVVEHYNTLHNDRLLWQQIATYAWLCTTAFLCQWWDPEALAEVAVEWDKQGKPARYEKRPVGDYREKFIPGHQVYADPRLTSWQELTSGAPGRWCVLAEVMTLEDISSRWQVDIDPDSTKTTFGSLVESFVTPWQNSGVKPKTALVKTCYENPTPGRYERGRVMVACGDKCLEYREGLPDGFIPLLPVGATQAVETPYHVGFALDALPLQWDYNLFLSRWFGALRNQKPVLFKQKGAGLGADVLDDIEENSEGVRETPRFWVIEHRAGMKPDFDVPKLESFSDLSATLGFIRSAMSEVIGVHPVSSGQGDANAKSGISIRLLQDSDQSSGAEFSHEFEVFLEERARRMGAIVSAHVAEPRAWEVDDKANPEQKSLQYSGLDALRSGGMASCRVVEGSATPRTPEAEDQQILDLLERGLLDTGEPAETAKLVLSLLNSPTASRVLETIERMRREKQERLVLEQELTTALGGGSPTAGAPPLDDPAAMPPPAPMGEPMPALPAGGATPPGDPLESALASLMG